MAGQPDYTQAVAQLPQYQRIRAYASVPTQASGGSATAHFYSSPGTVTVIRDIWLTTGSAGSATTGSILAEARCFDDVYEDWPWSAETSSPAGQATLQGGVWTGAAAGALALPTSSQVAYDDQYGLQFGLANNTNAAQTMPCQCEVFGEQINA